MQRSSNAAVWKLVTGLRFSGAGSLYGHFPSQTLRMLWEAAVKTWGPRPGDGAGAGQTMTEGPGFVLVVDDNAVNRLLLSRGIERDGHHVRAVANGLEALQALRDGRFDCVLLDVLMPELDGYQLLEHIRDVSKLRTWPGIMIAALEDIESVVRCIEMGADDYLPKPFDPVLLRARINAGLARKRLADLEQEYLEQVGHVVAAAAAVEAGNLESPQRGGVARPADPPRHLGPGCPR